MMIFWFGKLSYRTWLDKFPNLLSTVVYTYLRVIVDHNGQVFVNLRQKEVELCISILREKVQKTTYRSWVQ